MTSMHKTLFIKKKDVTLLEKELGGMKVKMFSQKIMSFFCAKKQNIYIKDEQILKEALGYIAIILIIGLFENRIIQSIIFLTCQISLKILIGIKSKESFCLYLIKSAFLFLVVILLSEIIDLEFYKYLILFYSGASIIGINMISHLYNKNYLNGDNFKCRKLKIIMLSIIIFIFMLVTIKCKSLLKYIIYISSPLFITYTSLIIWIIRNNLKID